MISNRLKLANTIKKLLQGILFSFVVVWAGFWYLSGSPVGLFKFAFVYYMASHKYMTPVPKKDLFDGALAGMIDSLHDPHSIYLDERSFKHLIDQTKLSYVGIGIVMEIKNHHPAVLTVIDGQPAYQAGIKNGDIIMKINGVDTYDWSLEETASHIRGDEGTSVNLVVKGNDGLKTITVKREKINFPTVNSKMLDSHIGYIRISQFAENTGVDFEKNYNELKEKGMTKLVLDLRDNPGGLVSTASEVGNLLLPKGPIVTIKDRVGKVEEYTSEGKNDHVPLVVLVNGHSASASEIIAGAVQDYKVGTIVGTKSYGKGTVQTVIPGPGSDAVKVTIAKYHTPADRVIDGIGIQPDVVVPYDGSRKNSNNDLQLQEAIKILHNSSE